MSNTYVFICILLCFTIGRICDCTVRFKNILVRVSNYEITFFPWGMFEVFLLLLFTFLYLTFYFSLYISISSLSSNFLEQKFKIQDGTQKELLQQMIADILQKKQAYIFFLFYNLPASHTTFLTAQPILHSFSLEEINS